MPTPVSAPGFRVTYFFSTTERKKFGWSESFYHPGPDSSTVMNAAQALQPTLMNVHAWGVTLDFLRITDLTNFRQQKLVSVNFTTVNALGTFYPNYVVDALLMSLLGSDGRRVRTWIRGIPDEIVAQGGKLIGGFGSINAFLTQLNIGGFVLRGLPRPQAFGAITAWDQTTGNLTIPGHGWTTPLKIRVKGVKTLYPKTFNNVFKVTVFDANTVTIVSWTAIAPAQPINLVSASAAAQYAVNTVIVGPPTASQDGSIVLGVTSHKTGRPFNLATGRSKGRRRAAPGVLVAS